MPVSRKRPAGGLSEPDRKIPKTHRRSTPGGASAQAEEKKPKLRPETDETIHQKESYLQVGRYLLEQFSIPAFRSHATIGLVDRDRIQFYHANHSVILVSSAINFSSRDKTGGLEKLIAIVIAFNRLSLPDNGILDGGIFQNNAKLLCPEVPRGSMQMQGGNKLRFGGNEATGPFTLTFGEIITRDPSLAGRSTTVLHAKSSSWKDVDLVVKISWPGSGRVPENELLNEAARVAESTAARKWALNHLPRVFFAQDVVFDSDSTHGKVGSLFDNAEFVDEEYKYERRTLRIIIQERLYPLKTLTNAKDVAQVLLDVACSTRVLFVSWLLSAHAGSVHRWLLDHAGILHRDLSLDNIMYRIIEAMNDAGVMEEKVYGVLTDYDLSSRAASLTTDYAQTSEQRTGTPPYMAHGLLDGTDTLHLYRHDVESLFYIMLILAAHHELQVPEDGKDGGVRMRRGKLRFQDWFDAPNYDTLGGIKSDFFTKLKPFEVSPSFKDFRGWLRKLQMSFACGFQAKGQHALKQVMERQLSPELEEAGGEVEPATFDEGTLGGHITYSALIHPARHLTGELEGLIIRYDLPSPPLPTSIGAVQVDA
jgi:hypothetical protein